MADLLSQFSANLFALDHSWFEMSDQNSAYLLWGYIRNAANVLLIIVLLIIIFSQLTGMFIDNYGIKKMLPKFIVSIFLINISFVICALAVDVSNLLGYGILGWLNDIQGQIGQTGMTPGAVFASILDVVFGVGAGAIALISSLGTAITTLGGPVILIGILIALLAAVLALAFVFLLLGAREIMCMILVAISPLAFFCLILPNTQKLFNKWMNMMKSLLMIYPIIAALYGGAKIVRVIIIGNAGSYTGSAITSFLMLMIGAALPFVPFFLVPSILKKALGAVAGGFEKLKAMGNKGINSAQRGFQNSNFAKQRNAQAMKSRFENGKLNERRRKNLNEAAKKKFGKNFDDLTDKEKQKLGMRSQIAAANLAAAGKRAESANALLNENKRNANKDYITGAMKEQDTSSDNKLDDTQEWNNDTISAMDVDAYDEEGKAIIGEDGKQKKQKAFYDKKSNSWKVDTGKKDANGNAIYKNVNKKQLEDIKKAQFGSNPDKVRIGENGEKEFTLNKNTGKYEHDGVEATKEEMIEINDNLAKGQMLQNYTRRNGRGDFVDSHGRVLEGGDKLTSAGFAQSWGELQRTKAAEARAQGRGSVIGGYAGQSSTALAGAAQLSAENEGMSRTNATLGQADALRDLQGLGYNTATSRISASQAAGTKLTETMKGNVGAMEIERTAGVKPLTSAMVESTVEVPLNLKEKAKLVNAAKAGNLDNIIRSAESSEKMKQIAREMKASGQDFTSFGAGTETSANISKFIDNAEASLRKETGIVTTSEKEQLVAAAKNGTLSSIATSTLASAGQIALAKQMLSSGKDYSSFGSSAEGSKAIKSEIDALEQVALSGGASLDTAQKERLTVSAKNGSLEADFINNPNASVLEKYAAQRILDNSSRIGEAGHGSQFIKQNIDSTLESISNNMGGIASIGAVMSADDTTELKQEMVRPEADNVLSIGRTVGQVTNAVSAGSTKLANQFETQIAGEKVGEVKINRDVAERQAQNEYNVKSAKNDVGEAAVDYEVARQQAQNEYNLKTAKNDINITPNISLGYAQTLEKQRFDISQEKMYDEELKLKPKGEMLSILGDLPADKKSDTNYIRSLLKGIMQKGGDDDIQTYALNRTRTDDEEIERVYDEFYAASTEPTLKAYGKFVSDVKNNVADVDLLSIPTFKQWCEGSGSYDLKKRDGTSATYDGTKFTDLQGYVDNLGNEALQNASRGYIKVMSQNEEISGKYSDRSILYGMVHNRDNEAQAELRTVISGWGDERRIKAMQTLSDNEIATMTLTDWNAVFGGDITKMKISDFASKGADLEKFEKIYNDSRLSRFMPSEVKEFIHKSMPSSTPSPITDATEIDHSKDDTYTSDMGM